MVTVSSLVERAGWGGRVAVYVKAVAVYFAVERRGPPAGGQHRPAAPSLLEALSKCAPITCLILLLLVHKDCDPERRRYRLLIALGLALSAAGDALLVWPDTEYLIAGMVAFAAAHVVYVCALGWRESRRLWVVPLLYLGGLYYTTRVLRPPAGPLRVLVPVYGVLLATMMWRAAARGDFAAAGGVCFVASDMLLGYDMFAAPLRHRTALVMSTYYLAQLLLALSAVQLAAPARSRLPPALPAQPDPTTSRRRRHSSRSYKDSNS